MKAIVAEVYLKTFGADSSDDPTRLYCEPPHDLTGLAKYNPKQEGRIPPDYPKGRRLTTASRQFLSLPAGQLWGRKSTDPDDQNHQADGSSIVVTVQPQPVSARSLFSTTRETYNSVTLQTPNRRRQSMKYTLKVSHDYIVRQAQNLLHQTGDDHQGGRQWYVEAVPSPPPPTTRHHGEEPWYRQFEGRRNYRHGQGSQRP